MDAGSVPNSQANADYPHLGGVSRAMCDRGLSGMCAQPWIWVAACVHSSQDFHPSLWIVFDCCLVCFRTHIQSWTHVGNDASTVPTKFYDNWMSQFASTDLQQKKNKAEPISKCKKVGTCGEVAMTSASHAEGRQFDPGQVYVQRVITDTQRRQSSHRLEASCNGFNGWQE